MANLSFNCSHCGAPISYDGSDVPAVECPFCNTTNIVPEEMRPIKAPVINFVNAPQPTYYPVQPAVKVNGAKIAWIIGGIVLFMVICGVVTTVGPMIAAALFTNQAVNMVNSQVNAIITAVSTSAPEPTEVPPPTEAVTVAPTPGYAVPRISFGKQGINPGQFDNPRFIATDGSATLYVAEDTGGRVQAFDLTGKYLYQWKAGDAKTIIEGLAADRKGGVFVSHDGYIFHYDGKTGDPLGKLGSTKGGEYGDLFMTPEGNLAAVWYEVRWGMITGLDGHSEAIVIFSPAGKVLNTISSPISSQTGEPALDVYLTMDGHDNLFLLDESTIYAFTAAGKYLNMFKPAEISSATSIRVDDQGQLFVGNNDQVIVLSPDGNFVSNFQVDKQVTAMAYDDNSSLWVLSDQQVTQFVKR